MHGASLPRGSVRGKPAFPLAAKSAAKKEGAGARLSGAGAAARAGRGRPLVAGWSPAKQTRWVGPR